MSAAHRETKPLPNSYWVVSGRFAAGEYPGAKQPARAAAKLQSFFSAGIDHFIDLTEVGELMPYAEIAMREATRIGRDVVYERHPIVDLSIRQSPETRDQRAYVRHWSELPNRR